jgi:hypothetical protein
MRWRLYYGDGSTHEGETDEDAFAAPSVNAILLKQEVKEDPSNWRGYSIRHGCTFFCWERIMLSDGTVLEEGRWGGKSDIFGLMDYYSTHKGPQKVLIGREIHDDTYRKISKIASSDGCLCLGPCNHVKPEDYI